MLKKSIYPKTPRFSEDEKIVLTEKLDGSNLAFFKTPDEVFYIAQRNYIFTLDEVFNDKTIKGRLYHGLFKWLMKHHEVLTQELRPGSAIIGEWIGMGKIGYGNTLPAKFMLFAKANIDPESMELYNIYYNHDLFIYPFFSMVIPPFIGLVPIVAKGDSFDIDKLNDIYETYSQQVGRKVEGFILTDGTFIKKYVRLKNGKLEDHHS